MPCNALLISNGDAGRQHAAVIDKATLDKLLASDEVELIRGSTVIYRIKPSKAAAAAASAVDDEGYTRPSVYETKVVNAVASRPARVTRK